MAWVSALVGALMFAPGCNQDGGTSPTGDPRPSAVKAEKKSEAEAPTDPEQLYLRAKGTVEATQPPLGDDTFASVSQDLRKVAENAKDAHLRANASLLLGTLLEERGDRRGAISYYRQARSEVPEEASAHAMLALALAADEQYGDAATTQEDVVRLVPDDLEAWLLLGEMHIKAGNEKDGRDAYAAYETRRKGLIDGLTLKKEGEYLVNPEDRAACAAALTPAADNGTALALLYALGSEELGQVRAEIARVMGAQRLEGYRQGLEAQLEKETEAEAREAIQWALAEISRDPVETKPGPSPAEPPPAEEPAEPAGEGENKPNEPEKPEGASPPG